MGKLSVTGVKAAKRPGRFGDGDGLFLVVGATGSKSCVRCPEAWAQARHRIGQCIEGHPVRRPRWRAGWRSAFVVSGSAETYIPIPGGGRYSCQDGND